MWDVSNTLDTCSLFTFFYALKPVLPSSQGCIPVVISSQTFVICVYTCGAYVAILSLNFLSITFFTSLIAVREG